MGRGSGKKSSAEIVRDKRGELYVQIALPDGRKIEAHHTSQGIRYSKPEWVPRYMKQSVVPELIKKIRLMVLHDVAV